MPFIQLNTNPTSRQLRQFGCLCVVVLPLIGWLWNTGGTAVWILLGSGLLIAMAAWFSPWLVRPLFVLLGVVAFPVGVVVSEAAMLLIYFGIFFPIGIIFRLMRRDALKLRMERESTSYWTEKAEMSDPESYYRQY